MVSRRIHWAATHTRWTANIAATQGRCHLLIMLSLGSLVPYPTVTSISSPRKCHCGTGLSLDSRNFYKLLGFMKVIISYKLETNVLATSPSWAMKSQTWSWLSHADVDQACLYMRISERPCDWLLRDWRSQLEDNYALVKCRYEQLFC